MGLPYEKQIRYRIVPRSLFRIIETQFNTKSSPLELVMGLKFKWRNPMVEKGYSSEKFYENTSKKLVLLS